LALSGNRRQRRGANGERSAATDEVVPLGRGRNPGAGILDVAAERNKSARYSEEQTVESVRNAADGTQASREARRTVDSLD
jgi:hypothetical protein